MRINKFLASCGLGSRRKVEEFILDGKIKLNGEFINSFEHDIDPEKDVVEYKGKVITLEDQKVYYMLNKPQGYLSTVQDDRGRPTVLKLLKNVKERIYPVGRLDYNTTGLLILTNDGQLTFELTHPKTHVSKTYEVKTKYPLRPEQIKIFQKGIDIGGYVTRPAIVQSSTPFEGKYLTRITIFEGKNRQVRRMFEAIGLQILELKRISIGNLTLGDLPLGKYRKLTNEELNMLK